MATRTLPFRLYLEPYIQKGRVYTQHELNGVSLYSLLNKGLLFFTICSKPCFKGLHVKLALTKITEAVVIKPKGYLRCICENMEKEATS